MSRECYCRLCGWGFDRITVSHLRWIHGITMEEYRSRFPYAGLYSEEAKEQISRVTWGRPNPHNKEWDRNLSEAMLGKPQASKPGTAKAMRELWADPVRAKERSRAIREGVGSVPNMDELVLNATLGKYFPGRFRINVERGPNQVVIGRRIPDYMGTNGRKEVIELFGAYWHGPEVKDEAPEDLVDYYKSYGYKCLVLWSDESWSEEFVVGKVKEFIGK